MHRVTTTAPPSVRHPFLPFSVIGIRLRSICSSYSQLNSLLLSCCKIWHCSGGVTHVFKSALSLENEGFWSYQGKVPFENQASCCSSEQDNSHQQPLVRDIGSSLALRKVAHLFLAEAWKQPHFPEPWNKPAQNSFQVGLSTWLLAQYATKSHSDESHPQVQVQNCLLTQLHY